jgi:hypothetical protein
MKCERSLRFYIGAFFYVDLSTEIFCTVVYDTGESESFLLAFSSIFFQ